MNRKIKNVLILSTAVALTSLLVACTDRSSETSLVSETTETAAAETTYATETTTAASAETAQSFETVELDSDTQLYANTFITNFVELYFSDYNRESSGIEQVLDFAHIHIKLNSFESISYETRGDITFETFTTEDLQQISTKYFGLLLTDDELNALPEPPETYGDQPAGPYFADGKIFYEAADGELYNQIGIVNAITNPGDGTLIIDFTIYAIDIDRYWSLSMDELHGYYALSPEQAASDAILTQGASGTATVGVAQSGEYYLISYSV